MLTKQRLNELAIVGLEAERAKIDEEIATLRHQGGAGGSAPHGRVKVKRGMSVANRKASSLRMKAYWAARRKARS
jgi:hypothetical protein